MGERLQGRVAIVTGAGSGIGRATALKFAGEGATVVVNDIVRASAEAAVDAIHEAGGKAEADVGDVTSSTYVNALVDGAVARHGRLDVMHNNAGGAGTTAITDVTDEAWDRDIRLNLYATFYGIRAALRVMVPTGRGSIISTSSAAGLGAVPGLAPYGAAKAGIILLTRNAAVEYAHTGVRANAITPGSMGTPAFESWLDQMPVGLAGYEAQIPQHRLGRPQEIADAALWLASDESSYVNGAVIPVDGGTWAKLASPTFDLPV
ncbi:MAG TPA: SDR family NAD(P)-dependent oxidoreductase [Acidimicrobiales bacterium]|jgi:3-oxoacyl-[acyl-carrier protein] reductase|nr:SDR family NAD(P)-dependent oxidoreductase [Acidimicrobiales bacterium]